jgi:hypothetical protein
MTSDPYVRDMLHAYRAGISINAIARAVGLPWLEVRRIVREYA